jgi:hypothetical protein
MPASNVVVRAVSRLAVVSLQFDPIVPGVSPGRVSEAA